MTTYEIYQTISNIEPENKAQAKLLEKLLKVIEKNIKTKPNDRTQLYINELKCGDIINREVGLVYIEYCEWCKKYYYMPIDRSLFSKRVCECLCVTSKVRRIDDKVVRVYEEL